MPFDSSYAKKAAGILLTKGEELNTTSLLSNEDAFVFCQVSLMEIPVRANGHEWRNAKQYPLDLVHPIHVGAQVCFISNDDSAETKSMLKELFRHKDLKKLGASVKVLPLPILKRDHAAFEAKRKLCGSFDLFLADDRIIPLLPSRLGKAFFQAQKQPMGVKLSNPEDVLRSLKRALNSTWVTFGHGSTVAIKVGRLNFTSEQIAANCESALAKLAKKPFVGGWKGLQTCLLQADGIPKIYLPIYRRLPVYVGPSESDEAETSEAAASSSTDKPKQKATSTTTKTVAKEPKQSPTTTAAGKKSEAASTKVGTSTKSKPEEEPEPMPKKTAVKAVVTRKGRATASKPVAVLEEEEDASPVLKKNIAKPSPRTKQGKAATAEPVPEEALVGKKPAKAVASSTPTTKKTSKRSKPEPEPELVTAAKKSAAGSKVQKTATKVAASSASKTSKTSKTLDTPKKTEPASSFSRSKSTGSLPVKKRSTRAAE